MWHSYPTRYFYIIFKVARVTWNFVGKALWFGVKCCKFNSIGREEFLAPRPPAPRGRVSKGSWHIHHTSVFILFCTLSDCWKREGNDVYLAGQLDKLVFRFQNIQKQGKLLNKHLNLPIIKAHNIVNPFNDYLPKLVTVQPKFAGKKRDLSQCLLKKNFLQTGKISQNA